MKLSILIPSIPERFDKMQALYRKIEGQIKACKAEKEVEILVWIDNRNRSIGAKRDDLVQMAKGDYLAFVDDDDDISGNYIKEMLNGCDSGKDVICFRQMAVDGNMWSYVIFSIYHENQEFQNHSFTKRKPFHVCGWKRELAQKERFADVGYKEDWHWCQRVLQQVTSQYKTDEVIHYYTRDPNVTAAPVESNEIFVNKDLEFKKKNKK